jgi:hypothetical protein
MYLGLNAVAQVAQGAQMEMARISDMHARITFEGTYNEALAQARKAVVAACESLAAFGYKPGPLIHYRNKSQVLRKPRTA